MNTLLTGMPYTPADRTDIRKTWVKHGWQPAQIGFEHTKTRHTPNDTGDDYDRVMREDWLSAPGGFRA